MSRALTWLIGLGAFLGICFFCTQCHLDPLRASVVAGAQDRIANSAVEVSHPGLVELVLTGEVADEAALEAAERAALDDPWVRRVDNQLTVRAVSEPAPEPATEAVASPDLASETVAIDCRSAMDAALANVQVRFDSDRAVLRPDATTALDRVAEVAEQCPNLTLTLTGHTDSQGNAAYNQRLSERRSTAVSEYLTVRGVSADRISVRGAGETSLAVSEDENAPRESNRRVEIQYGGIQ